MKAIIISLFLFSIILVISCQQSEIAQPKFKTKNARNSATLLPGVEVVPLNGSANGYTYKRLLEETYKWSMSKSISEDPFSKTDGSFFLTNQPLSEVMILVSNNGGETERSITIPADTYTFFPLLGLMNWEFYDDPACVKNGVSNNQAQQRLLGKYGRRFNTGAKNLIATLNGEPMVADFSKYRVTTDPFKAYIHPDYNQYNNLPCTPISQIGDAQADFYALLIKLPQGQHTVHLAGDMVGGLFFHSGITWHIKVE